MNSFLIQLRILDKILSIKVMRELKGLGLKEAKDLVESFTPETKFKVDLPALVRLSNLNAFHAYNYISPGSTTYSERRYAFDILLVPQETIIDLI
jgi:hypothetical protein